MDVSWLIADYPVKMFGGTKSIVISTVSWIGGKQPFLGWAYIAAAALLILLGLAGTIRHLVKPRRLGDMSCKYKRGVADISAFVEPACAFGSLV